MFFKKKKAPNNLSLPGDESRRQAAVSKQPSSNGVESTYYNKYSDEDGVLVDERWSPPREGGEAHYFPEETELVINEEDHVPAIALFQQGRVQEAADMGLPMAMGVMSERYYFGEDGCETDPEASNNWALKAAAAGDRVGQFRLAWSYQYGEAGLVVDYRQATTWFKRAAEQGCEASMNNLGYLFKRGGNGILRDMTESLYWFKRGAEAGDIYAQDNLGACFRDGVGVSQDHSTAREWFRRSAEGGNVEAQSALGTLYVMGLGGAEDIAAGFALWQRAATAGEETAQENLDSFRRLAVLQTWKVP